MGSDTEIRAKLNGYHWWAICQLKKRHSENDYDVLSYVLTRWLDLDRESALAEFGISRDAYIKEIGGNVESIEHPKNRRASTKANFSKRKSSN